MQEALLKMSLKEIERAAVLEQLVDKKIQQKEASMRLGVSLRQVKRLLQCYRKEGAQGLVSQHRGRISNRQYSENYKAEIQAWVKQEYPDFGPTLAAEKLLERQGLSINKETLRQWMLEWGLWKVKQQRKIVLHPQRERRACYGELIQIDGSPHDWFEGRREKCCLLVFIDDATSRIMHLRFEERETTLGYLKALKAYEEHYGLPLAFYSDKLSVFRVNNPEAKTEGETQFGRVCRELGIALICAHSPQAKGLVERANGTLQDRLVKELRLQNIDDLETANAFLPAFMAAHNTRFAVKPRRDTDSHRAALFDPEALRTVMSLQHTRTLSKNLEFSFENKVYQIQTKTTGYRLRHAKVQVCEGLEGEFIIRYKGKTLAYRHHVKQIHLASIVGSKDINAVVEKIAHSSAHTPKADHPWREYKVRYPERASAQEAAL